MADLDSKEYKKLETFSTAQSNTIVELSRKLKVAQDEIVHLKKLLQGSVPLIAPTASNTGIISNVGDQEYICRTEINKLRDISKDRELTLEEVKKLDIFSKILKDLALAPKGVDNTAKKATDEELLAAIESESNTKQ
jgi:hypothetical protein